MERSIGKRICAFRKAQGLTQEQLGSGLHISGQAVSKWENEDCLPDILLLPELCAALAVSADTLLGIDGACATKGQEIINTCTTKDIAYYLRILADENCLAVLRHTGMTTAVTRDELMEATGIDKPTTDCVVLGFMKRDILYCGVDSGGKRGYLGSKNMPEVYKILEACGAMIHGAARESE